MSLLTLLAFGALALGLVLLGAYGALDDRTHRKDKPTLPEPRRKEVEEE